MILIIECGEDYLVVRNGERSTSPFFLLNPRQVSQHFFQNTQEQSKSLILTFHIVATNTLSVRLLDVCNYFKISRSTSPFFLLNPRQVSQYFFQNT
jgi:hypothetical protein